MSALRKPMLDLESLKAVGRTPSVLREVSSPAITIEPTNKKMQKSAEELAIRNAQMNVDVLAGDKIQIIADRHGVNYNTTLSLTVGSRKLLKYRRQMEVYRLMTELNLTAVEAGLKIGISKSTARSSYLSACDSETGRKASELKAEGYDWFQVSVILCMPESKARALALRYDEHVEATKEFVLC